MTMFLEKIRSEGLAHLSYIVGHAGRAAVIDPRRDCQAYIDIAREQGARITHVFETHKNEDYVTGSRELARRTGAEIHHGKNFDFDYGSPVEEGDSFEFGDLRIKVLETPGHTYESISLVLEDNNSAEGKPVAVFTGDALFIGDVGRTDFFPDRRKEVAELLYDSIHEKLLPLGDDVLLYPAHGAGSVCGSGMAPREFSTIGIERRHNPMLSKSREEFVKIKSTEQLDAPAYFKMMEKLNKEGSDAPMCEVREPKAMMPDEFAEALETAQVVDIRSPEAVAGAFIEGSIAIPTSMISGYAGYFLDYDRPILLVSDSDNHVIGAWRQLIRMGFDNVEGYLAGGMHDWEISGRNYDRIRAVHVDELVERINSGEEFTLLDVRKDEEVEQGKLPGAVHIFLGELPDRLDEIPSRRPITTFCGSGMRAVIAASILKKNGYGEVEDSLGSMAACQMRGCPIEK